MRKSILEAYNQGTVIYGECGGMMYLLEKLIDCDGRSFKMCEVLRGSVRMENRRQGLGYIIADTTFDNVISKRGILFVHTNFIGRNYWMSLRTPFLHIKQRKVMVKIRV